jgi:hypothetical protein
MNKAPLIINMTVQVPEERFAEEIRDVDYYLYIAAAEAAIREAGRWGGEQAHGAIQNLHHRRTRDNRIELSRAAGLISAPLGNTPIQHVIEKVIAEPIVVLAEPETTPVVEVPAKPTEEELRQERLAARHATVEARFHRTEELRLARKAKREAEKFQGLCALFETEVTAA